MTRLYISILSVLLALSGVAAVLAGRLTLAFCLLLAAYLCLAWVWSLDGLQEVLREAGESVKNEAAEKETVKEKVAVKETPSVPEPSRKKSRPSFAGAAAWTIIGVSTLCSAFVSEVNAGSRLLMAAVGAGCLLTAYNFYKGTAKRK